MSPGKGLDHLLFQYLLLLMKHHINIYTHGSYADHCRSI
jgi:hypothetical protein